MKKSVIVLGSGLVGGPMAADLAREDRFQVTAVDVNADVLQRLTQKHPAIIPLQRDLSDPAVVTQTVADCDLVINAVPGFLGYRTMEAILQAGKNVVDIAFFPEDAFGLDELAKANQVTAVVDCGVAPGMSNLLVGHVHELLDETESVLIYVGGLPEKRTWPFEYKAVFSPIDVIEEYTRPARYVENGHLVVREALSDPELIDFPNIGTLEAFNTDGLRTLATTIDAPNKKEKTLRYQGHIEKMAVLRATGFFDEEEVDVRGVKIRPLDLTARLLFPKWKLEQGEVDLTIMQIIVEGRLKGKRTRYTYDLFDRYDPATDVHSMARTTGYTATTVARMLTDGLFSDKGIIVPEWIGKRPECVEYVLKGLKERGVEYRETITSLPETKAC